MNENEDNLELSGIPPSLGTSKCYECQAEPNEEPFWEVFKEVHGDMMSVPLCPVCFNQHFNKPNYICKKCGYARAFMFLEGHCTEETIIRETKCPECNNQMSRLE